MKYFFKFFCWESPPRLNPDNLLLEKPMLHNALAGSCGGTLLPGGHSESGIWLQSLQWARWEIQQPPLAALCTCSEVANFGRKSYEGCHMPGVGTLRENRAASHPGDIVPASGKLSAGPSLRNPWQPLGSIPSASRSTPCPATPCWRLPAEGEIAPSSPADLPQRQHP